MSTPQGCNDDSDVIETFKEALKQRVGHDRFQIWFSGVDFHLEFSEPTSAGNLDVCPGSRSIVVTAGGQFAADRLSAHYLAALRGAAAAVFHQNTAVRVQARQQPALPVDLPFSDSGPREGASHLAGSREGASHLAGSRAGAKPLRTAAKARAGNSNSGVNPAAGPRSLQAVLRDGTDSRKPARTPVASPTKTPLSNPASHSAENPDQTGALSPQQPNHPNGSPNNLHSGATWENFVAGPCNELARTACRMAIESPGVASPLVLWGPPGSGKSHLLHAVATKLRTVHRMRRVVYLAAEEFTNDFIKALNGNCLPAFRSRFRDADALLIDDIQFFVEKKATIRELHHLIEMLAEVGKPLVFAGTKAPSEINGLGGELSGRLASGLVCQLDTLDEKTRLELLARYAASRCPLPWPASTLSEIAALAGGDGRLLSGIVNLVSLLQRMHGEMPSMDQIRVSGAHLLRSAGAPVTLGAIERAVEKVFQLDNKSLQSNSQTKSVTEPRMLAMYLARELTSSAFSEIGGHFGGRSHSTAILANQRVRQWLGAGSSIGRGRAAVAAEEAIRRIEAMLKTG